MHGKNEERVIFWGPSCLPSRAYYQQAVKLLTEFHPAETMSDFGDVMEWYQVFKMFTCPSIKEEYSRPYMETIRQLMPLIAREFKNLNNENFSDKYDQVLGINEQIYVADFWKLFEKFQCFDSIVAESLNGLLMTHTCTLYYILQCKKLVEFYDRALANALRSNDQAAEFLAQEFLEEKREGRKQLFFPKSLSTDEYEKIFLEYINSEAPLFGVLSLLSESRGGQLCPISGELRIQAKHKIVAMIERRPGLSITYGVKVSIREASDCVSVSIGENHVCSYIFSSRVLKERITVSGMIEVFRELFHFVDRYGRSSFPSLKNKISIFEDTIGVKGIREYKTGYAFNFEDIKTNAIIASYYSFLKGEGVNLEKLIEQFFQSYTVLQYGIQGLTFLASNTEDNYVLKCKNIVSEIDSVLKQYKMVVEKGTFNNELFELSSESLRFDSIPSLFPVKYIRPKSGNLQKEMELLFRHCLLLPASMNEQNNLNLFQSLTCLGEKITLSDCRDVDKEKILWLKERGAVFMDEKEVVSINYNRCLLLEDMYYHEDTSAVYFLCGGYASIIEQLIRNDEVYVDSTMFSKAEQDYLNYMLNNVAYDSGRELRNKYSHGTYSRDAKQNEKDYFSLLKIMVLVMLKIDEELWLKKTLNEAGISWDEKNFSQKGSLFFENKK